MRPVELREGRIYTVRMGGELFSGQLACVEGEMSSPHAVLKSVDEGGEIRRVPLQLLTDQTPRPFGPVRAAEIWATKGPNAELRITAGEEAYVRQVWDAMTDGASTWMTAFWAIARGEVPYLGGT